MTPRIFLSDPVDFAGRFTRKMMLDWAASGPGGRLPMESAEAFAAWLDTVWTDYADGSADQTNLDVLKGALHYWTGGRS